MVLNQICSNYSPGVKFGPAPGITSFRRACIEKTLEILLYLDIKPRVTKFCMWDYLVGIDQEHPNYSALVKFGPTPGVTSFT